MTRVLVVDDEKGICKTVTRFLEQEGYEVESAGMVKEAWELFQQKNFDIVITDILMPKSTGFDLLDKIVSRKDNTKVIMITGEPAMEAATKALRKGAFDFFAKPVSRDELAIVVSRAAKVKKLEDENLAYRERLEELVAKRTEKLYETNLKLQNEIDEKQKVRKDLETREEDYKLLADNIGDVILVINSEDFSLEYCSPSTGNLTGFSAKEMMQMSLQEYIAEDSIKNVLEQLKGVIKETETIDSPKKLFEADMKCKDGSAITVEIAVKVIKDKAGKPYRILGVGRDITERKTAEKKLIQSEERYRNLVDKMNQGLLAVDENGKIKFANRKLCEILGYDENDIIGMFIKDFLSEKEVNLFQDNFEQRKQGKNESYRLNVLTKNKEQIPFLLSPQPVYDENGKFSGSLSVCSNVMEQDSALELLEFERKQLLSIFDTMEEIVFVSVVETNELIYMNAFAKEVLGEAYGHKCYNAVEGRADNCGYCLDELFGKRATEITDKWEDSENEIRKKWFKCNSKVISWPDGRKVKIHLVIDMTKMHNAEKELKQHRDNLEELIYKRTDELQASNIKLKEEILEREKTEEKLRHAVEVAESATRAKSDFLANMSHEIRTPMNGVIGMTTLLLQTELDKDQRSYTEIIQKSSSGLLTLINDILDFSKIESGKLEIDKIDFDLRQTIEDIGDMLAFKANEKKLNFVIDIDPDVPSLLVGDPTRLRQVIVNLTDNAIKFTEKGEVFIGISLEMETAKSVKLRFMVKDTGIGIPKNMQPLLFDAFIQGDPSRTRKFGGTGLGLTICKKFVNLMGGKIGLESVPEEGSEFWFTLGFEKQDEQTLQKNKIEVDLSGERILVVDEKDKHTKWMEKLLVSWGSKFTIVFDEMKLLNELEIAYEEGQPYTLAIINYDMDHIAIEMMVNQIKRSEKLGDLTLIVMANLGKRGDALRMKRLGFSAYITKPVKQSILFDCLVEVVESRNNKDKSLGENKIITKYSVADKKRRESHRILIVEDDVINQKVASLVLKKMGYSVEVVDNGQKAIDELKENDYNLVLMDCTMPVMDGYEASKRIRDKNTGVINSGIPIIAMTAHALDGEMEKCFESGMNDYITKPIDVKVLSSKIDETIKDRRV